MRLAASDVANFLACRRLTQLDLRRARGELRPPREFDIGFQDLVRRGEVARASRAGAVPRGGAGRRGRQRGGGYPGRGRGDGRGHPGRGRGRLSGDAGRRRPRDGAVRAAGFPGAGGPAACAGRGAAAGRGPLRGRGRQAGPVGEGPRRAADLVLLAAARRRAGDRAALDAPGAGQRGVRLVQGGRLCRLRAADPAAAGGRIAETAAIGGDPAAEAVPGTGRALCHLPVARSVPPAQADRRRPVAGGRDDDGAAARAEGRRDLDPARVRRAGRACRGWTG